MPQRKIAFVAADTEAAQSACERLKARYSNVPAERADTVVALGGDGFMLQTLHRFIGRRIPIYGMQRGSIGFLLNTFREDGLPERVAAAIPVDVHPLSMTARGVDGRFHRGLAINEVSLLRETRQAAKIALDIDGVERMAELICDGVLVSTPAGSTAYNLSAHGPILPLTAGLLAVTSISAFRPRRWRGALVPRTSRVGFRIREAAKRPVSATADHLEVRDVSEVTVVEDRSTTLTLLFDPEHGLEERILNEQFQP